MDIWGLIIYLLNLLFAFFQAALRQPTHLPTTKPTTIPTSTSYNATRCPTGNFLNLII